MGHRSPSAAPSWARVRVQACEALVAHRRGDRMYTHIQARARQSMADARSPIGATGHLVFPGRRLIQTPAHQRGLTPVGRSVFPRVIACGRDPYNLGHHSDRVGSPCARPSVQSAGVVVPRREEGAGFPTSSFSFFSSRTRRRNGSDHSFHLAWIRTALTHSLAPLALECDPPAHHRFTQPHIPSHRHDL